MKAELGMMPRLRGCLSELQLAVLAATVVDMKQKGFDPFNNNLVIQVDPPSFVSGAWS
jgi:hypothetical protein